MKYKYSKKQLFGKRLEVPKKILKRIYACYLSFEEFIRYDLVDKIPTSCLKETDREIVEKFGIERCKELDWELLNSYTGPSGIKFKEVLMSFDADINDLNAKLYEIAGEKVEPIYYSSRMKEIYPDKFMDVVDDMDPEEKALANNFNNGKLSLEDLVRRWSLFQNKDISYCLKKGAKNKLQISDVEVKEFMKYFGNDSLGKILDLVPYDFELSSFIHQFSKLESEEEKRDYLKEFTDGVLQRADDEEKKLSNSEYKILFHYSSLKDYFRKNRFYFFLNELDILPPDYIFDCPIPISVLKESYVYNFIDNCGLKNIVEFDQENGHFFTENNFEILRIIGEGYFGYRSDELLPQRKRDENDNYQTYTKDEFYEIMKKMIMNGPSNWNYYNKALDYRDMIGEFRTRNKELYISKEAPEELQKLFYTKSITPHLLAEHPEFIQYLNGKELSSCFEKVSLKVKSDEDHYGIYENLYTFLESRTDFDEVMKFVVEYCDVIDILKETDQMQFYQKDGIKDIKKRINELLKNVIIKRGVAYPKTIPSSFREMYPTLFLTKNAPNELQEAFYNRKINSEFILSYPKYLDDLRNVELEAIYQYMPVRVDNGSEVINIVSAIKKIFGEELSFDVMLLYGKYIEKVFDARWLSTFNFKYDFSEDDLLDELDASILKTIISGQMKYDESMPSHFKNNNPTLFLNENVPKEIRDKFYNREFTLKDFEENSDLLDILGNVNIFYGLSPEFSWIIELVDKVDNLKFANLTGLKLAVAYSNVLESEFKDAFKKYVSHDYWYSAIEYFTPLSKLLSSLSLVDGLKEFQKKHDLTDDFFENLCNGASVICKDMSEYEWIDESFKKNTKMQMSSYDKLRIVSIYLNMKKNGLEKSLVKYIKDNALSIDRNKIEFVEEVLFRLSLSNSSEIWRIRNELASQILSSSSPIKTLEKIEDMFIKNNIPTVGKVYSCFEILHPEFQGFNFDAYTISPVLKNSSNMSRKVIVFSDLIKASFGSNNRSVNAYLKNIEVGSDLYESIKTSQIQYELLSEMDKNELITFSKHLSTLYDNTIKGKNEGKTFTSSGNVLADISELSKKLSPDGTLDYHLKDRVIRMFCGFAGIDTLDEAKEYINKKIKDADTRNREAALVDMTLEQGDFIKGIGDITYLGNILQNGSVSKEYLGSSADSDSTPLDTDVSMIMSSDGTIKDKMSRTAADGYGPIWFVLKNDDRFITTRNNDDVLDVKRDMSKMEVFYTGVLGKDHYGIRTGFASSEINYIVMENYDSMLGLEIAMNGFYIPVANKEGKIVFTPKDYDDLRSKMNGLSYYGEYNYVFSDNLVTEETEYLASQIEKNNYDVQVKKMKINEVIKNSLEECGLHLKMNIDGDLTEGVAELIDTGSTGRGTNKPGDGDFDFMLRLDKNILSDSSKLNQLKQTMLKNLGKENTSELTSTGDFRLKGVQIDNDINVDIDITFTAKTDKISYSTDMSLQDRLTTIQRIDPEKYKYVVANILLAKQILKEAGVYKPNRGDVPQGGLGGVGIENWILQNGGSFIDAANQFLEIADCKNFEQFKSSYQIWDFGDNFLAESRVQYLHDNFVSNNMSESGYEKMVQVLKEYVKSYYYVEDNNLKK